MAELPGGSVNTSKIINRCPHCDYATDRATAVGGGSAPSKGDFSLCIKCGEWSVFGPGLLLRPPTDDEFVIIGGDPNCRRAREAWVTYVAIEKIDASKRRGRQP